jgi:hypothetical protein
MLEKETENLLKRKRKNILKVPENISQNKPTNVIIVYL